MLTATDLATGGALRATVPRASRVRVAVGRATADGLPPAVAALLVPLSALLVPLAVHAGAAPVGSDAPSGRRLVEAADAVLRAHLATRADAVRLRPLPLPAGTALPGPSSSVVARPVAAHAPVETRMRVWVDVHAGAGDGGRFLRSVPVTFDVQGTLPGWIATRDVRAGTPIADAARDGALKQDGSAVGTTRGTPVRTWLETARLRRALPRGEALVATHLETTPFVSRGDTVSVVLRDGPIGVEAKAEALQDGPQGAAVWVRIAQSTAPVRARVVGPATVEVLR